MHFVNTFVEVAPDTRATAGTAPPVRGASKSVANLEYELIATEPYVHTHDDALFAVHARRAKAADTSAHAQVMSREEFFSGSRACMRASALPKTYGWGLHFDAEGRVALVGVETERYRELAGDPSLAHTRAMRSKRA